MQLTQRLKAFSIIGFFFLIFLVLITACGGSTDADGADNEEAMSSPPVSEHNTLTEAEKAEGWKLLFDGKTTNGWKGYLTDTVGSSWRIADDALYLHADRQEDWAWKPDDGGFILTVDEYEDFELRLQWKISDCGNSGIIYHAIEDTAYDEPWKTGLEMQVLDNKCHPDSKIEKHRAGDLYDLIAADPVTVKPAGEWNDVRIVSDGNTIQHWLNGEKVVEVERFSEAWKKVVGNSKFANPEHTDYAPDYGTAAKGHIALQDHDDSKVWYRNIKIKEL
jgi:cytochrome c